MRCRQARLRLTLFAETGQEIAGDKQLLEDLEQCSAFAREAQAAGELCQAFAEASHHDEVDQIGWPEQVCRVEALATGTKQNQPKEKPFMSTIKQQMKLRPRLSLGLAAAVIVLIGATVIPLKFDQTVGFEVAVAGVDRNLALDQDRLNEMMERLGVGDVHVDIKGCEATCNLVVSDLSSEDDAQMVKLAFEAVGSEAVHVALQAVREDVIGNAFKFVFHSARIFEEDKRSQQELQSFITERLGTDFEGDGMMFISMDEDGGHKLELISEGHDGSEHEFTWVSDADGNVTVDDKVTIDVAFFGDHDGAQFVDKDGNVFEKEMHFSTDGHGGLHATLIQPGSIVDGHLTAEAREAIEAMGYTVEEIPNDDGSLTIRLTSGDANNEDVVVLRIDGDGMDEASKEVELPEGFELSQNYPNPFNPTTRIDYGLPQSEHVTIAVYNINGQKVRTLVDEMMPAGQYSVMWDATSDSGDRVASGIYLYRFSAGEVTQSKKMTLVK
jgi:hypothetical protein